MGKSQFVTMDDGIKLHVVDWGGKGTPLVLLAGLALNAHTFDFVAQKFTDKYRVIGITRAGHGASEARTDDHSIPRQGRDILAVLDELNIESAVFAGHSFAGAELTYLGKTAPHRVQALVYIDALQALEYMNSHVLACPDLGYTGIDMTEYKAHFYNTQRLQDKDGNIIPFADLPTLGELLKSEVEYGRDYAAVAAPALAISHIPEKSADFFFGQFDISGTCIQELNKLTYLGIAEFIKHKPNSDVAAVQNSQHMLYMGSFDKVVNLMDSWLTKTLNK